MTTIMKNQSYKPLIFVIALSLIALTTLVYLNLNDAQRTVPKIKLSYFKSTDELNESIFLRLNQELKNTNHVWIGIEPEKQVTFDLALKMKKEFEKIHGSFDQVYVDKELSIKPEELNELKSPIELSVKSDFYQLKQNIEKNLDKKILVITAAIYSTNFIQMNPLNTLKKDMAYHPKTFSMGYLSLNLEDEKNNIFPCVTEDKTGTADWGCAVINKSRSVRRKINLQKLKDHPQLLTGLMDLSGENDYIVLVR